jgi:serine/threonine-protein kinase
MVSSVKASQKGLELVEEARTQKKWSKANPAWCQRAATSQSTLKRFWQGEKIQKEHFIAICEAIGLNWEDVAEVDQVIRDRYKLVELLNNDEDYQIFQAEDLGLGLPGDHPCIVKKLISPSQNFLDRFERGAEIQIKLDSYHVTPKLLAYFKEDDATYSVEEFIEGKSLASEFTRKPKWTEAEVLELLIEILEILKIFHDQKTIHRAVSPHNLIRRSLDGKLILTDLVGSKEVDIKGNLVYSSFLSQPGLYIAPEQSAGVPRLSSDLYAVGMIGVQAIIGKNLEDLEKSKQLSFNYESGDLEWMEDKTNSLEIFVNSLIRYDFNCRPKSAEDALERLKSLIL